CMQGTHFPPTF
nr:immunoglobulin light chain junction region [Macaca mulatta]